MIRGNPGRLRRSSEVKYLYPSTDARLTQIFEQYHPISYYSLVYNSSLLLLFPFPIFVSPRYLLFHVITVNFPLGLAAFCSFWES